MFWQTLLLIVPCFILAQEVEIISRKNLLGQLSSLESSDRTVYYELSYDNDGNLIRAEDKVKNQSIYREYDTQGNLTREIFPNNQTVTISYDDQKRPLLIWVSQVGGIQYTYDTENLLEIKRLSVTGELLYQHSYERNDFFSENLIGDLGNVKATFSEKAFFCRSPYSLEDVTFDNEGNVIQYSYDGEKWNYKYDDKSQLILHDSYDSLYNPLNAVVGENHQLKEYREYKCEYDIQGNLIKKEGPSGRFYFYYDPLNRLVKVVTEDAKIILDYDFFNRRLSKTIICGERKYRENYIYLGGNEIAVFAEDGRIQQFRVPGRTFHPQVIRAVSIETPEGTYAPIHDLQGNITKLIDVKSKEVFDFLLSDPFGGDLKEKAKITPWVFSGKHYDSEIDLVYFGERYYDPSLKRWTSPDPLGSFDSENLYVYLFNNPYKYIDPNGQFVVVIPVGVGLVEVCKAIGVGFATWAAYEALDKANKALNSNGLNHVNHLNYERIDWDGLSIEERSNLEYTRTQNERALNRMQKNTTKKDTPDSSSKLQKEVERDQAPDSVERVDKGRGRFEKDHVHLDGEDHALNYDGTWKHGGRQLTNWEKKWLLEHGWEVPGGQ